eukprot:5722929-Pyramimonas_sp.AAC.1
MGPKQCGVIIIDASALKIQHNSDPIAFTAQFFSLGMVASYRCYGDACSIQHLLRCVHRARFFIM